MEIVHNTDKWKWGLNDRNRWDLQYKNKALSVSVTSIDELSKGQCTIDANATRARRRQLAETVGLVYADAVTCIAESTYGLTGEGITSYKWSISGDAEFVQGTDVTAATVGVTSNDDKSVYFTLMCDVNGGKITVYEKFRHQRWITTQLMPRRDLVPADDLEPGYTAATPVL